jgi:hypothetical protein
LLLELLHFLCISKLWLYAEVVMTSLFSPEFFQLFSLQQCEFEVLLSNLQHSFSQSIQLFLVLLVTRYS